MKRDLQKMEREGIELQNKNGKVGLSITEVSAICNAFLEDAANGGADITGLIFKCFSLGVAAGSRLEKNNARRLANVKGVSV